MTANSTEELFFDDFDGTALAVAFHRAASVNGRRVVLMAHGFHGSKVGGSRHFVDLARQLVLRDLSTLRFDQAGSGDSAGSFEDASFDRWVSAIEYFARRLHADGFEVAILGESMGGTAAMAAAARLATSIRGIALWSPDPLLNAAGPPPDEGWMEEAGQRVRWQYWREAVDFDFLDAYRSLVVPVHVIFGTADHFISLDSMRKMEALRKPGDTIQIVEGLPHSAWPVVQGVEVLRQTCDFLVGALAARR